MITHCQICTSPLNLLQLLIRCRKGKQNMCNNCKKYVCCKCNNSQQRILDKGRKLTEQKHKICYICNEQFEKIATTIQKKNIAWGKDSEFSNQWLKRMKTQTRQGNQIIQDYQYQHFLSLFKANIKCQKYQKSVQLIDQLVKSIEYKKDTIFVNYSLELFYCILKQRSEQIPSINNILYAINARYDEIQYSVTLLPLCEYLLCYCSEETSYIICCDIIENIFPDNFLIVNRFDNDLVGFEVESYFLKEYFVYLLMNVKQKLISAKRKQYQKKQIEEICNIVELSSSKYLLNVFTMVLPYFHLEFIWNQLSIQRSFQVIQKIFLGLIYLKRQQFIGIQASNCMEEVLANIQIQIFIQAYYDIQIDKKMKTKLYEQFSSSLKKKRKNIEKRMNKLNLQSAFTNQQIKLLKQHFSFKQDNFSKSLGVINRQDFVNLIKCYYSILKQNDETQAPTFEITSENTSRIFDNMVDIEDNSYIHKNKTVSCIEEVEKRQNQQGRYSSGMLAHNQMLNFQQFFNCFLLCTKSNLKDKICGVLVTYRDKNKKISFYNFQKVVKNICSLCPPTLNNSKQLFFKRINQYFSQQKDGLTIQYLSILLNDNFINQFTLFIRSDAPNIMVKTLDKFNLLKNRNKICQ